MEIKPYRFRKIYADCVTGDGTLYVAYIAELTIFSLRRMFGGIEMYLPDGGRKVIRACEPLAMPDPQFSGSVISLRFPFTSGALILDYQVQHGGWRPSNRSIPGPISWWVGMARGRATATWSHPDEEGFSGIGYLDWVEVDCPTRLTGLRMIEWGRAHLPDSTTVFCRLRFRGQKSWQQAVHWGTDGSRLVWDDYLLTKQNGVLRFQTPQGSALTPHHFTIVLQRTLESGSATSRQRFQKPYEWAIARIITGPSRQNRWLGRASLGDWTTPPNNWVVYEQVQFGKDRKI